MEVNTSEVDHNPTLFDSKCIRKAQLQSPIRTLFTHTRVKVRTALVSESCGAVKKRFRDFASLMRARHVGSIDCKVLALSTINVAYFLLEMATFNLTRTAKMRGRYIWGCRYRSERGSERGERADWDTLSHMGLLSIAFYKSGWRSDPTSHLFIYHTFLNRAYTIRIT